MQKVKCTRCGCARRLMLKGVKLMDQEAKIEYGLKPFCIPCLLKSVKASVRKEDGHLWAIMEVPHAD